MSADDPLAAALRRFRPNPAPEADLRALARHLDERGCAFGRVTAARLDDLVRAYDRLEAKLNAVLLGVTGTFLTTLVALAISYLRSQGV